jgi:hypothetical protein
MSGPSIQTAAVLANQDRTFSAVADGRIDGAGGAHQGDERRLGALADDTQHPVAALDVLDVGVARLRDPQAVQAQQHGQGGVGVAAAVGGQQEAGQLAAVETAPLGGVDGGAAHARGRVRRDPPVEVVGRRTYWAGLEGMRPSMWANR